jgi:hypothetical protein
MVRRPAEEDTRPFVAGYDDSLRVEVHYPRSGHLHEEVHGSGHAVRLAENLGEPAVAGRELEVAFSDILKLEDIVEGKSLSPSTPS